MLQLTELRLVQLQHLCSADLSRAMHDWQASELMTDSGSSLAAYIEWTVTFCDAWCNIEPHRCREGSKHTCKDCQAHA